MAENTEVKSKMISIEQMRYDALIEDRTRLRAIQKYVQSSEYMDKEFLKLLAEG